MLYLQGRLSVPVHPAHSIYAHFKHVQGIPSTDGGVPLFKLRILDSLIDQLLGYREKVPGPRELHSLAQEKLDPLIGQLHRRLQERLLRFPSAFGGFYPQTGMLVDLVA